MKIITFFLLHDIRTGAHRRLLELAEDLARKGNTVLLLLNQDLDWQPQAAHGIRIPCAYKRTGLRPVSGYFKKAVKQVPDDAMQLLRGADAIMIHGETNLSAANYLRKRLGIPVLYGHRSNTVRDSLVSLREKESPLGKKIRTLFKLFRDVQYEKWLARSCDRLVFQSPYDRDDFVQRNSKAVAKAAVIRGNIGLPRFNPAWALVNTSTALRRILFIGTMGERKGLRYLLQALPLLQVPDDHSIQVDIAGPGPKKEYWESWIQTQNLPFPVRFHGRINNPFEMLAATDVLVVPSNFDSYPDTVLEGLHVGTLVLGSQAGGIPDMLNNDQRLLFPVQNSQAIADKLNSLMHKDAEYRRLRDVCRKRREFFLFDWAAQWEKEIQSITGAAV